MRKILILPNTRFTHDDIITWMPFSRYTGPLCGEFTGNPWIPRTMLILMFLSCRSTPAVKQQSNDRWFEAIAQIAPLSFQGSHRTQTQTSEVRWLHDSVVTEWSPACLHKQFRGDLHRGNWRKPQMEDVHNLINIGPTNPIQILNQHEIF